MVPGQGVRGAALAAAGCLAALAGAGPACAEAVQVVARAHVGDWRIECVRTQDQDRLCEMFAVALVDGAPGSRDVILQVGPSHDGLGQEVAIVAEDLGFDDAPAGIRIDDREILDLAEPSPDITCAGRICQIDGVSAGMIVAAAGLGQRLVLTGIDGRGEPVEAVFDLGDFSEGYRLWRQMQAEHRP